MDDLKRKFALPISLLWGFFLGMLLGYARTESAATFLLEKNRALDAAGFIALPGNGHWETLSSIKPALAGGLFFAFTLGMGSAIAGHLAGRLASLLPRVPRKVILAACIIFSLTPIFPGDFLLAATMGLSIIVSYHLGLNKEPATKETIIATFLTVAILTAGFIPLFISEIGAFTTVRNGLISNPVTRHINDFYYSWTLYPAETIKPLLSKTQITAFVSPGLDENTREIIAMEGRSSRIFVVDSAEGAEITFAPADGKLIATAGWASQEWPLRDPKGRREALQSLSRHSDTGRALRNTTLSFLLFGVPLAFLVGTAATLRFISRGNTRAQLPLSLIAAALLFFLFSEKGADFNKLERFGTFEEVREAITSQNPVHRIYGVRGGFRFADELEEELINATTDPIVNIRYTAAIALGRMDSPGARKRLAEMARGEDYWYVKERAYGALDYDGLHK